MIPLTVNGRTHQVEADPEKPLLWVLRDALPENAGVALNERIRINRANVITLVINHSEMGQGALTGLVALLAEGLDAELEQVRTVFAPVDAVLELAAAKAGWGTPIGAGCGRRVAIFRSHGAVVAQVAEVGVADPPADAPSRGVYCAEPGDTRRSGGAWCAGNCPGGGQCAVRRRQSAPAPSASQALGAP